MNKNFFLDLLDRVFFFRLIKDKIKPFNRTEFITIVQVIGVLKIKEGSCNTDCLHSYGFYFFVVVVFVYKT